MANKSWRLWVVIVAAIVGFAVPLLLRSLPPSTPISAWVVLTSCPPLLLSATVDLSWIAIALVIAPINAAMYAAVAFIITVVIKRPEATLR